MRPRDPPPTGFELGPAAADPHLRVEDDRGRAGASAPAPPRVQSATRASARRAAGAYAASSSPGITGIPRATSSIAAATLAPSAAGRSASRWKRLPASKKYQEQERSLTARSSCSLPLRSSSSPRRRIAP